MKNKMESMESKVPEARFKIMKVTERLFREKGYSNTSINEICRKSGISKGTFYYHFRGKEHLLFTFIDDFMKDYYTEMEKILSTTNDSKEKIRLLTEISFDFIQPDNINIIFWLSLLNESTTVKHRAAKYFDQMYEEFREKIAGYIKEGKRRKQFKKELNAVSAAIFITGVIEGTAIQLLFDVDFRLNPQRLKRDSIKYIMEILEK